MWLITDEWDVRRTIAAISVGEKSIRDVVYTLIDERDIRAIGIEVKQTPGETVDGAVNASHRDLMKVSAHKVARLARLLRDGAHEAVNKDEIFLSAHANFKAGHFDIKMFATSQRKNSGDIIEAFLTKKLLDFV